MDASGGSKESIKTQLLLAAAANDKGAKRRNWTAEENEAFLCVLEELVADGERASNGTFKSGAIDKATTKMQTRFPGTDLNSGHVTNRLKGMTRRYGQVINMLNTSGFRWDDVNKCVVQDSKAVWNVYKKVYPKHTNHVGVHYPEFDRIQTIFGRDRAAGPHGAIGEMVRAHEIRVPVGESSPSMNSAGIGVHLNGASASPSWSWSSRMPSPSTPEKRKRDFEALTSEKRKGDFEPLTSEKRKRDFDAFGELVEVLRDITSAKESLARVEAKIEAFLVAPRPSTPQPTNKDLSIELVEVLESLDLSREERVDAMLKIGRDPMLAKLLINMASDDKLCFVKRAIRH